MLCVAAVIMAYYYLMVQSIVLARHHVARYWKMMRHAAESVPLPGVIRWTLTKFYELEYWPSSSRNCFIVTSGLTQKLSLSTPLHVIPSHNSQLYSRVSRSAEINPRNSWSSAVCNRQDLFYDVVRSSVVPYPSTLVERERVILGFDWFFRDLF